jgi:hypothetical protein
MNSPQLVSILQIISNSNSLKVLSTIANSTSVKSKAMKNLLIISKKQFYSLTGEMLRTGLIQRRSGSFSFTAFGRVIYNIGMDIEKAANYYWKFKAIDSIQSSGQIRKDELAKLIKTMIDDEKLQNILTQANTEKQPPAINQLKNGVLLATSMRS